MIPDRRYQLERCRLAMVAMIEFIETDTAALSSAELRQHLNRLQPALTAVMAIIDGQENKAELSATTRKVLKAFEQIYEVRNWLAQQVYEAETKEAVTAAVKEAVDG